MDNGCHSADIVRYLLGPIKKVIAIEGKRGQEVEVEDTVHIVFKTEQDVTGTIDLSWSIHKQTDNYISVYGTEGMLSVGWKYSKYRQSEKLDWVKFGKGYNKLEAFSSQLVNFVSCINKTDLPLITDDDALQSIKVVEASYKSLQKNQWKEV